jgi:hypothetical protein
VAQAIIVLALRWRLIQFAPPKNTKAALFRKGGFGGYHGANYVFTVILTVHSPLVSGWVSL